MPAYQTRDRSSWLASRTIFFLYTDTILKRVLRADFEWQMDAVEQLVLLLCECFTFPVVISFCPSKYASEAESTQSAAEHSDNSIEWIILTNTMIKHSNWSSRNK